MIQFILGGIICLLIYKFIVYSYEDGWKKGYRAGEETMEKYGVRVKYTKGKKRKGVKR